MRMRAAKDARSRNLVLYGHGRTWDQGARGCSCRKEEVLTAAEELELCRNFCDDISGKFEDMMSACAISHDAFIRTTEKRHFLAVESLWKRLVERGYLYVGEHEGWYCSSDETFVAASQVVDCDRQGPVFRSPEGVDKPVRWLSEQNWMFRLEAMEEPLRDWLSSESEPVVLPQSRLNEVREFLAGGLKDISVSRLRSKNPWAIPVPPSPRGAPDTDEEHSVYVWLDALCNYLTVCGSARRGTLAMRQCRGRPRRTLWART